MPGFYSTGLFQASCQCEKICKHKILKSKNPENLKSCYLPLGPTKIVFYGLWIMASHPVWFS